MRAGFRLFNAFKASAVRNSSTAAGTGAHIPGPASAAKVSQSPFAWSSPVGPKTVHFWAPVLKVRLYYKNPWGIGRNCNANKNVTFN
jgi:mitochondrial pyruvate carrier 2